MTNKRSSFRLTLESLESRDCPTVAYTFLDSLGGVLLAGNTSGAGITVGSVGGDVSVDGVDTGVAAASVGSASLQGSGGANYLQLDDADHSWIVSAVNAGSVSGMGYPITFAAITSLVGGAGVQSHAADDPKPGYSATQHVHIDCAHVRNRLDLSRTIHGVPGKPYSALDVCRWFSPLDHGSISP